MKDILTKGTAEGVRIYALCTTNLVQEAAIRHHTSHLASAALGRAMNGALLLAATMKDNERIALRLKGDGPIGEVVADAEGTHVRGYVGDPDVFLPLKNGKLDVGGAIGAGNIIVTRYLQNAEPFTGYAELVDGEIASDLTNYLYTSEQTPSSVALGVLVNKEGQVIASGGYFIQAMPGCAEETLAQLEENISLTPYVTQLLELGYTPEKMIETIARGLDVTIQESIELSYKCRCSREKILGALATLGQEDISAMSQDEETEVHCQFCNETYKFSGEEIARLLKKLINLDTSNSCLYTICR